MSVYPGSIAELGVLFTNMHNNMLSGAPLAGTLEIIRKQFEAHAVALSIEPRGRSGEPVVCIAKTPDRQSSPPDDAEIRPADQRTELAELMERYHCLSASQTASNAKICYSLSICRDRGGAIFDPDDAALAEILLAQLGRSMEVASRIDSSEVQRMLYSDVLDRLHVGVVIADATGKATSISAAAERLLSARDGLLLQNGRLRAESGCEDKEFQAAFRGALQRASSDAPESARGLSLTKRSGARTLGVMIRPVVSGAKATSVAIYIRDCGAAPEVESEFVRQIFDLTPAEAAVTRRLTAGLSLEDTATALDISRNTARAHLRSIFSKSGITRQTELVRLVLNSAVILGGRPRPAI